MPARITVLHLAPHPDDEALGAPVTLLALRAAGHRVVNLACGLGRPADHERRRAEVSEACRRAGFELVVHDPPLALSSGDDLGRALTLLIESVGRLVASEAVDLVVSPSPHDGHPAHELVGRAALAAGVRWWMWGLWADLPVPTLYSGFGDDRLAEARHVLGAHAGELARNDFDTLLGARAAANRVLGSERVFGSGAPGRPEPYAELLTEAVPAGGDWLAGQPRLLDPSRPLAPGPYGPPIGWWLHADSVRTHLRGRRG